MVVQSFVTYQGNLIPIEVELVLMPGLPQIHFLGLPDQHMKESTERIKCALKKQGFEFPKSQQVLVNLRPSYVKKTSRGAELAVAAAFLWETGQVPPPLSQSNLFLYGEIDLQGNVYEPGDLSLAFQLDSATQVMTGAAKNTTAHGFQKLVLSSLKELVTPSRHEPMKQFRIQRVDVPEKMKVKSSFANLIRYFGVSPFHLLLAGPAGSGKSTLAKNFVHFLDAPKEEDLREISSIHEKPMSWWPLVAPHPTITAKAFLGNERYCGEVFRAHRGILFLDELLEFKPEALEVLRAPLDGHELLVSRMDQRVQKKSDFKCVATTNLCPCGEWLPGEKKEFSCVFAERKCLQYRQKLSGPILDRFEVLFFTHNKNEKLVSFDELLEEISVKNPLRQQLNVKLPSEWEIRLHGVSARRRNAFLKLLSSVQLIHENLKDDQEICEIAYDLTIGNFLKLQAETRGDGFFRNTRNHT